MQSWSPYFKKDIEVLQKLATEMVYGCWDLNFKDILALFKLPSSDERVIGDLVETFRYSGVDKLDFCTFFKLLVDSKVRGHTYKIVKNSFHLDV